MMTRKQVANLLCRLPWVLRGTLVERHLKCRRSGCATCRDGHGHGPVYYLSVRGEDGKTHMVYVPKEHLDEVRAAVGAYKRLKKALAELASRDLERWGKKVRRARR